MILQNIIGESLYLSKSLKINDLEFQILEISKKYNRSHLSSCLSAVGIIDEIYSEKKENEIFILSNGHAGLSLYCILNKYYGFDAEQLYLKHGTHPNRDINDKIFYSTGSLGCGLPAACGMALANKNQDVYCLISDAETFEGSIYESFNLIQKYKIDNLHIYVNINGFGAMGEIDILNLSYKLKVLCPNIKLRYTDYIYNKFPFLSGVEAHYHKLTEKDWEWVKNNA